MGQVICIGIQKGGAAKTTTTGILGYMLSKSRKVLLVDMDSQGNLTEMITQVPCHEFNGRMILDGIKENNLKKYVLKITESLHLLPSNDLMANFPRYLYQS